MAWRPTEYLIEGELDNTTPGKITGWMKFLGLKKKMKFNLEGNFHRDIRGAKIRFFNDDYKNESPEEAKEYMQSLALLQEGKAGDITAGLPPQDYVKYPYIEWFSEANGRVVIELVKEQVELLTMPIPHIESDPLDRKEEEKKMADFLQGLVDDLGDEGNKDNGN